MSRTASELHGTGADISLHGTPGALHLGDTEDGMIRGTTEVIGDGTTHGTTADGMIRGITAAGMEAIGAGTTHGIIHITLTTDGMTLIGDTYMVRDTGRADRDIRRMYGTDRDTRPVPTGYSPAAHHSEAA